MQHVACCRVICHGIIAQQRTVLQPLHGWCLRPCDSDIPKLPSHLCIHHKCPVLHTSLASSLQPLHLQIVFKPYMVDFLGELSARYNASGGLHISSAASNGGGSASDGASASSGSSHSLYTALGVSEERQLPAWAAAVLQTVEHEYLHLGELRRHNCVCGRCYDKATL